MTVRHVAPTLEAARAVIAGDVGLIVVEGDMPKAVTFHRDCTVSYVPDPPASFVRAVESGERIEIASVCETCGGDGHVEGRNIASWDGCWVCNYEPNDSVGLVVVGSVQATAVLPVIHQRRFAGEHGPWDFIMVWESGRIQRWTGRETRDSDGSWWDRPDVTAALSVYGPPASLIGRFVIVVTDPRRTE